MRNMFGRLFLAAALTWLPLADASAAVVQITVKDSAGTNRTFNVTTNTDLTGNLDWNNVICDQAAGTTCASVGTAGSPSTNALTVQAVTLGSGTATNAMRVELANNGTGVIATVGTITNPVTVSQATAASLNATVVGTGTFATQSTLAAETTKVIGTVRNLGNAGAVTDFVGQAATAPANAWLVGATFFTTPTTLTNGQASPLQLDNAGNLLVNIKAGAGSGGTAIADNAAFTQGTTNETPIGCYLINGSYSAITAGHVGVAQCDSTGHLLVSVTSAVGLAQGSTTSGQTGSLVMAAVTTSAPSYTTAQTSPLSLDTSGNLRVNVVAGGAGGGAVFGPTAVGSAAANPPVLIAGTANAGATGNVQVAKVTSGGVISTDLSTVNGVTTLTGTGAVGTGAPRVAVGTDTATIAGSAPSTVLQSNSAQYGGTAVGANPCITGTISYLPVSQATSTQIAALGGSSKKNYICAIDLVGADAENISVVEGTGSVCATTTAAIMGGTTAANGWNFAANGGISKGNGGAPIAAGSLTSLNNVCILQSGSGRVAGSVVLAQQ